MTNPKPPVDPRKPCPICNEIGHGAGYHESIEPTGYHESGAPVDAATKD